MTVGVLMRRALETRRRRLLVTVALPLVLAIAAAVPTGVAFGKTSDFPITCGMTISNAGTFTLSSDLTCGTDGAIGVIYVRSATGPVTIDLQGHTLFYTVINVPIVEPMPEVTIEHGTIEAGLILTLLNSNRGPCVPLTLSHLTINDSPAWGVKSYYSCGLTLTHVVISNSAEEGVYCEEGGGGPTISDSLITNNGQAGVYLNTGCGGTITHNTITHNGVGIALYDAYSVITHNLVNGNRGDGISIIGNTGFDINNSDRYLRYQLGHNIAIGNGGFGIFARYPVTDLGGNVAAQNGATPQCVNVGCVPG